MGHRRKQRRDMGFRVRGFRVRGFRVRGFTLIEVIIVMAIIGIMAAVSVSMLNPSRIADTTEGFGDQIVANADVARLRALSTGRWQRMEFTATSVDLKQATTDGMGAPVDWMLIETMVKPGRVEINSTDTRTHLALNDSLPGDGEGLPGTVDFAPDGTSQAFTVFLQNNTKQDRFRVVIYRATGAAYVLTDW